MGREVQLGMKNQVGFLFEINLMFSQESNPSVGSNPIHRQLDAVRLDPGCLPEKADFRQLKQKSSGDSHRPYRMGTGGSDANLEDLEDANGHRVLGLMPK